MAATVRLRTPGEELCPAQWRFLHGEGTQPDHQQHGISDKDAQAVRIKLAGLV